MPDSLPVFLSRFVVRKVALVVLWKVCNLLGFLTELVSQRVRLRR